MEKLIFEILQKSLHSLDRWLKVMSHGNSGAKQERQFTDRCNRSPVCLFYQNVTAI